jgi:hypothetical protein
MRQYNWCKVMEVVAACVVARVYEGCTYSSTERSSDRGSWDRWNDNADCKMRYRDCKSNDLAKYFVYGLIFLVFCKYNREGGAK